MSDQAWSTRMADSVMSRHPVITGKWAYEWGLLLKAILEVWRSTKQPVYFDYVKTNVDRFIGADGSINTYNPREYNLDNINPGKLLFSLYQITGDERYRRALALLKQQLDQHPRTSEGGFWHKQIYPHQMWLDGIYMASPFLAEYGSVFNDPACFDDVVRQITLIESHTRDPQTALLYHGWDETGNQQWANPQTGCSPHFWGRAIGWYLMAIPDVLEHLPQEHPGRNPLVAIFQKTVSAIQGVQDQTSGLWYQVLDRGNAPGNYLEASASCMFVYAIAKGIRQGYLEMRLCEVAQRAYQGILNTFITVDHQAQVNLNQICSVAGLGGTPYRDGSFEYYISEPVVTNDHKGVGPFILASIEMERL